MPQAAAGVARGSRRRGPHSDVAVVVVGYSPKLEGEGFDRKSMDLPAGQDELIEAVAAPTRTPSWWSPQARP
jgi:hypothetical protein